METRTYVQSVSFSIKVPNGRKVVGRFTGLAMVTPEEWEKIKSKSLAEILHGEIPIQISEPRALEELIIGEEEHHDIIDAIRDELKSDHHDTLSES